MTTPTVLITGANRGIGLELTRQFLQQGWAVLACCRNPSAAPQLTALTQESNQIEIFQMDVTDYQQVTDLSAQLKDRPIDLLLSNAGIYGPKSITFGEVDAIVWREVLEVNTIAPLMLVQAFAGQVAASHKKLIAIVSSKVGSIADNGSGGSYMYRSSKTAVNQVMKSLSIDLSARGVSVFSLHPGWVATDMGGPNAEISVEQSVAGLMTILQSAGPDQNGQFLEYNGATIPW
ncbi:MAG: SDR family oxidoreductase [Pseudomonadota bacterium]